MWCEPCSCAQCRWYHLKPHTTSEYHVVELVKGSGHVEQRQRRELTIVHCIHDAVSVEWWARYGHSLVLVVAFTASNSLVIFARRDISTALTVPTLRQACQYDWTSRGLPYSPLVWCRPTWMDSTTPSASDWLNGSARNGASSRRCPSSVTWL